MMVLIGGAFFAMWYFLTYYFQSVLGYDPVRAGFAFFPMALGHHHRCPDLVAAPVEDGRASVAADRRHPRARSDSSGSRLIKPADSYIGHILVPSFICAFAMGLLFAPLATAATVRTSTAPTPVSPRDSSTPRDRSADRWRSRFLPPSRPT